MIRKADGMKSEGPGATLRPSRRRVLAAIAGAGACSSFPVFGGEDRGVSLFNGRDLTGWHGNPKRVGHGTGGRWQVEDGAITGAQDPPGNGGLLLSDATYGDFELSVEIRPDWGIDSGLFVRGTPEGKAFQVSVDHYNHGHIGLIYGEGLGGFNPRSVTLEPLGDPENPSGLSARDGKNLGLAGFSSADAATFAKAWKWGEWNTLKVRIVGQLPRITTWINGVRILDVDFTRYNHPDFDPEKVKGLVGPEGHIAFQIHGGTQRWKEGAKCRWRNIVIRRLNPVASTTKQG